MPRGKAKSATPDHTTLQMALVGYEIEKERIAAKIRDIQSQLGGKAAAGAVAKSEAGPKKRVLSAAARKRIAAAQRKRWAEHRKKVAAGKA
ncbi:MAG TPA: hypothetical protein VN924_13180 [Bryobacteraceae bacterium]|jgi:hypothetical protein|nr:hypothetical protein [Bryobacteraceae bacterium]